MFLSCVTMSVLNMTLQHVQVVSLKVTMLTPEVNFCITMKRFPVTAQAVLVLAGKGAEATLELLPTAVDMFLVVLQEIGVGAGVVAEVALVQFLIEVHGVEVLP